MCVCVYVYMHYVYSHNYHSSRYSMLYVWDDKNYFPQLISIYIYGLTYCRFLKGCL